jgi:hypothetical protein
MVVQPLALGAKCGDLPAAVLHVSVLWLVHAAAAIFAEAGAWCFITLII